jgi:uncharacterized protein
MTMSEVFADSSYWLAILNAHDELHAKARQIVLEGRLITTMAVQLEVMDAFSLPRHRPLALAFWHATSAHGDVVVVPLDAELQTKAVTLFEERPDKAWSLTDCISFVVMEDRGITTALTSDHHF